MRRGTGDNSCLEKTSFDQRCSHRFQSGSTNGSGKLERPFSAYFQTAEPAHCSSLVSTFGHLFYSEFPAIFLAFVPIPRKTAYLVILLPFLFLVSNMIFSAQRLSVLIFRWFAPVSIFVEEAFKISCDALTR